MKPTREQLRELLRSVVETEPREIDCQEFLDRVGRLLETLEQEGELPLELHEVSQHLRVCPECSEEFEALLGLYPRARSPEDPV